MRVRFWGTRGSIAKPGRTTLRYGGNTSCVEVRSDAGTLLVLDCGTGAHGLGAELTSRSRGRLRGSLLIGHTHWDHIQGFPFFAPLFASGSDWEIYAPGGRGRSLEKALEGQMAYEYSPIAMESVSANLRLHNLTEGAFELGSIRVTTQYLNHPALTLGYRLEADGATLVYATDHEPHSLHPLNAPPWCGAGTPRGPAARTLSRRRGSCDSRCSIHTRRVPCEVRLGAHTGGTGGGLRDPRQGKATGAVPP